MPRVTAAHEQAVRQRIVRAATDVFAELGFRRATIQDVVRKSGLSVGAVYNHFKSKEELFLVVCLSEAEHEKAELDLAVSGSQTVRERLKAAAEFAVREATGEDMKGVLLHAWSDASESPELRELLSERRAEMSRFTADVLDEAVGSGELPDWIDTRGIAAAFVTLVDGMTVQASLEDGASAVDARRQVLALLELLLAAPKTRPA